RERSVAAELAVEADEEELLVGQILASGDGDAVFCLSVGHGLSLLSGEASAPAVLLPRLLHEVRARRPRLADRLGTRELRVRLHELRGHLVDLLGGGAATTIDAVRLAELLGDRLVRCGELVARAQHLLQRVAIGLLEPLADRADERGELLALDGDGGELLRLLHRLAIEAAIALVGEGLLQLGDAAFGHGEGAALPRRLLLLVLVLSILLADVLLVDLLRSLGLRSEERRVGQMRLLSV